VSGLVEQLQLDAMDPSVPVSTLLRKVKVAAVKLGLDDALTWVENELGGYKSDLPDYRLGRGQTVGWNPYHGWQPIHFADPKTADVVGSLNFFEPIASYEALLDNGEGPFQLPLPNQAVAALNETFQFDVPRVSNNVPRGVIVQIVQHVRDMVLNWALELARAGVTGEGLGFTPAERQRATGAHITIGTFHGSFNAGDAVGANSRINQGSHDSSTNIAANQSVFGDIEHAVRTHVLDLAARDAILGANNEMRASADRSAMLAAYNRFIAAAADHMGVIAPFLPALGSLLT
jgi:hypothetical protein